MRRTTLITALAALVAVMGCAKPPQHFVNPKYDFGNVKKVAVLPLENLTGDTQAGERVRKAVVAELLAAGVVDVVEPGQVNLTLNRAGIQSLTTMSVDDLKKVGAELGAQLLFLGSTDVYDRVNFGGGTFPEVTINLRAVDAQTGTIVWSAMTTAGGVSLTGRLFGVGADTMTEATQKSVRAALTTLFR